MATPILSQQLNVSTTYGVGKLIKLESVDPFFNEKTKETYPARYFVSLLSEQASDPVLKLPLSDEKVVFDFKPFLGKTVAIPFSTKVGKTGKSFHTVCGLPIVLDGL